MPESAYPTNYPNNIAYRRPNRIREEASTRGPRRRVVRQHKEPFQPAVDDLLATARRAHTPERALIKADTHPDSPSSRVFGARQPRRTTSREKEKLVFLSSSSPKEASVITIRLRRLFFQAFFFFFYLLPTNLNFEITIAIIDGTSKSVLSRDKFDTVKGRRVERCKIKTFDGEENWAKK